MYSRKGDSGRAIAEYNEAIRLNPNYAQALGSRGLAYANKGDVGRAMADYNAAIRVDPNGANNLCNRGKLKLQISDASGHMDIERARQLDASACRTRALALEENSIELLSDQVIDY
jgi:tetratricopeptide (TPR) repeat protein